MDSLRCNFWRTSVLETKIVRDFVNHCILLKCVCSWKKKPYKNIFFKSRYINLMYLFLKLVVFDEMETFGLVESDCGRTVHITSNIIFGGNEMFVFR